MKDQVYIVAQAFPPVGGSHVSRIIAFQNILSKSYSVTGISIKVGYKYPVIDSSSVTNLNMIRTYPGIFHAIMHGAELKQYQDLPKSNKESTNYSRKTNNLRKVMLRTFTDLYRRFEIIDSYHDWIFFLFNTIRKNVPKKAMVVSSSMPNSVHVATLLALLGRKNFWWADFGDPWTLNKSLPRNSVRSLIESYIEYKIVKRANLLTFTTTATLKDYAKRYQHYSHKMELLRMGFNEVDADFPLVTLPKSSVFYGGSLPTENRDSSEFVQAILRMQDINFIFSGSSVESIKRTLGDNIPSNITFIDWLNHGDFISYLKSADISVIFGNSNYQQVPGKIYHYAAFANQILYISNIDAKLDETFSIIQTRSESALNDRISIEVKIRKMLSSKKTQHEMPTELSWESSFAPILEKISEKEL